MLKKVSSLLGLSALVVLCSSFVADYNAAGHYAISVNAGDTTIKGKFISQEGRFTISFPSKPVRSKEAVETAVGDIDIVMYMLEASRTKAYLVGYSDYPAEMIEGSDTKALLAGAQGGVVENLGAKVTSEKYSKFGKYDALDFSAQSSTYYLKYKLVIAKNRLYQIGILQEGAISKSDEKSFIGSFKIKD